MTLEKITSALNQGGQHLGDIVYWTLAEARIDRSVATGLRGHHPHRDHRDPGSTPDQG